MASDNINKGWIVWQAGIYREIKNQPKLKRSRVTFNQGPELAK